MNFASKTGVFTFTLLVFSLTSLLGGEQDYLVCIHGIFGDKDSMKKIAKYCSKNGWDVTNWEYASREKLIAEHATDLVDTLNQLNQKDPVKGFHFVTHSMGGLVLRAALNHPNCPEIAKRGTAVLLAPPNGGTCLARLLKSIPFRKYIFKSKAGKELSKERAFDYLGDFPTLLRIFVIAGKGGKNPLLMGENDGAVAVRETYLNTPHEHIVVDATHDSLVSDKSVLRLIVSCLKN